jgi:hypothetical protein
MFTKPLVLILLLMTACGAPERNPPAPVAGATESTSVAEASSDSSSESGSSTTGPIPNCAEGNERLFRWEDEFGGPAPTPEGVRALYRFEGLEDVEVLVDCGEVDDIPTCWVACGDPTAVALIVDWECETRVHTVTDVPFPAVILFPGCVPIADTSSGSDTSGGTDMGSSGSSSGTDSGSSDSGSSDSGSSDSGSSDSGSTDVGSSSSSSSSTSS